MKVYKWFFEKGEYLGEAESIEDCIHDGQRERGDFAYPEIELEKNYYKMAEAWQKYMYIEDTKTGETKKFDITTGEEVGE